MATKKTKNTENGDAGAAVAENIPAKTYSPRNIKYIGRRIVDRKTGKVLQDDQPVTRTAGADRLELPGASEQKSKRIFYHERAGDIVAMFPRLYKLVVPKGKK